MSMLATIHTYLICQEDVLLVYLRGALSDGIVMPNSDYDLIVCTRAVLLPWRKTQIEQELIQQTGADRVILIPLHEDREKVSYAVVLESIQLFERDLAQRMQMETTLVSHYKQLVCPFTTNAQSEPIVNK